MTLTARFPARGVTVTRGGNWWAWTTVSGVTGVDVLWAASVGMNIRGTGPAIAALIGLLALSVVYRHRSRRLSDTAETAALWVAFTACACVLSYLAATFALPLRDTLFAEADRWLGFDWWAWRHFVREQPLLGTGFGAAYMSLGPQILLSVLYLPAIGKADRGIELLLLSAATVIICCVVSAVFPALGPSTEFNYIPDVLTLRAPGPWQFDLFSMNGIIEMPSFHTTMAVLLTYTFRNTGLVGWGVAALNVAMIPSIPPIGGHYLFDVLSGAAVAALAIGAARRHLPVLTHKAV